MKEIIIFILSFYFLLISVISYGIIFQKICFGQINNNDFIYTGFYGLMFVTFIALLTSFFLPHNFYHNLILHCFGFIYFIFSPIGKNKNYFKYIFYISLTLFSLLLISKTNDDFSYYHLPFTKYLTEHSVIFGIGHLNHGYNLLSSLFFLNSSFYLPFIEFYSFHFSLIFFLIFFNYFLLHEIFVKNNDITVRYLYFFTFSYFNISFNRIAEFGTDKAGQLLIVLLVIKLFEIVSFNSKNNKLNNILFLLPLLGYCISLKTYFLPYILLSLVILFMNNQIFKNINYILFSRPFLFLFLILTLNFSHHFISTGCIISPLSKTCFVDSIFWSRNIEDIKSLSLWLEQWAKAGAGPGFRVENPFLYVQNFNWLANWIEKYFIGKFLDQLTILFVSYIIIFLFFKNLSYEKNKTLNIKKFIYFYLILLILFFIWFNYHPTLRYGGYAIFFLIISYPLALAFGNLNDKIFFHKKFKFFIIFVVIIINLKNFDRIKKEFDRNDIFKFTNFPFYAIKNQDYKKMKFGNNLAIYIPNGHCWATPSPCGSVQQKNLTFNKKGRYKFIQILK
tara:strand:- start:4289 stop:5974 length:1686 start_codon:yes stop_codon:yes gene_type:complete